MVENQLSLIHLDPIEKIDNTFQNYNYIFLNQPETLVIEDPPVNENIKDNKLMLKLR